MIRNLVLKLFYLGPVLCLSHSALRAQGLYINPGANVVVSGSPYLVLKDCDLSQNGTFTAGIGTVKFTGSSSNSTISGANINFNNLTVDEATADVVLNTNIGVMGNVNMVSRNIELNNNNLDLGSSGMIMGEGNSSYITGYTGGYVMRTDNLNAPVAANPGNIGVEVTSAGNLGSTLVRRGHLQQTGTTNGIGIARYFDIIPTTTNAGLNATLDFHYLDHELIGINEVDLVMSARDVPMGYWHLLGVDALNLPGNVLTKNSIDTMGRFTLSSSTNNTLPIMLMSFYGSLLNSQTLLKWEVANELSIIKYDVEKSADGLTFSKLGTVKANGAQSMDFKYEYVDAKPFFGANYYRLKLYDNTNNALLSKTIRVDLGSTATLSVFPNPVLDKVTIDFTCTEVKPVSFQLMDVQGKIIALKDIQPQPGANRVEWDISSLPAATYYLKLNGVNNAPIKISKF